MYKILFTKPALKEFSKLNADARIRIGAVVDGCGKDPFQFDYKKLKSPLSGYRIRTGNYRLQLMIEDKTITVYSVRHRKDAYK